MTSRWNDWWARLYSDELCFRIRLPHQILDAANLILRDVDDDENLAKLDRGCGAWLGERVG